jgi:hypothetical protein
VVVVLIWLEEAFKKSFGFWYTVCSMARRQPPGSLKRPLTEPELKRLILMFSVSALLPSDCPTLAFVHPQENEKEVRGFG